MNVTGIILGFIGVVLIFAGFRKTYQNWYSTFTGKGATSNPVSGESSSTSTTGMVV
jgi:hypothetical protein